MSELNVSGQGATQFSKREFLRAHEVARLLGISHDMVLRHLRSKRIPGLKLGKVWLVRASELQRFLDLKEQYLEAE